MLRNVRNFWIEGAIDGRNSPLSGGPKNKVGGLYLDVFIRNKGCVEKTLSIYGVEHKGKLRLTVFAENRQIYTKEVDR